MTKIAIDLFSNKILLVQFDINKHRALIMQKIFLLILSLGMILLFNQAQTKSANLITQQQTSCVICLKNLDEIFLPFCVNGHQFHKLCISQLFSYTKFACCPNCRSTEYSPELIQFFQKKAAKIELYRVSGCKKFLVFSQNPNFNNSNILLKAPI